MRRLKRLGMMALTLASVVAGVFVWASADADTSRVARVLHGQLSHMDPTRELVAALDAAA